MTLRSDREKEKQRRQRAIEAVKKAEQNSAAIASRFHWLKSLIIKNTPIFTVFRVSSPNQQNHLVGQILHVKNEIEKAGGIIAGMYTYVGKGSDREQWKEIRKRADELGLDTIVWESADRAIRHPDYGGRNACFIPPNEQEFSIFNAIYQDCILATCLPPEATEHELAVHRSRRGQAIKGTGGRGRRKSIKTYLGNRNKALRPIVRQMYSEGASLGGISHSLNLPKGTVQKWIL